MICPVAVVGDDIQAVCTCFLSFVNFVGIIYKGLPPESSCKRLFYFLHGIPQGGIANGLNGLNPRNTAHSTPLCKMRPALVWRPVMPQVHGGTRLVDKVNKLVIRTWGLLIKSISLERVGYLVSTLGRTIVNCKVKENEYV